MSLIGENQRRFTKRAKRAVSDKVTRNSTTKTVADHAAAMVTDDEKASAGDSESLQELKTRQSGNG
jgi:hypothetical protein